MINDLLIAFHTFPRYVLTSFSVDEILVPRYVNLSTDFRGIPHSVEMVKEF